MKITNMVSRLRSNLSPFSILTPVLFLSFLVSTSAFANSVTYVDNCDATVLSSYAGQTFVVTNDIVKENAGSCIVINHDNVSVDCQDYRLTGIGDTPGFTGVFVSGSENVSVQNCEFYSWTAGIRFYFDSDYGVAVNNKFRFNDSGIIVFYSDYAWLQNNKMDDNVRAGIQVNRADFNVVYDNASHGTGFAGILLNEANENYVVENQTNLNMENGIRLQNNSDNNYVFDNTSNGNFEGRPNRFGIGIAVTSFSTGNFITDNTANRNDVGISHSPEVTGLNTFSGNRCKANTRYDDSPDGLCK